MSEKVVVHHTARNRFQRFASPVMERGTDGGSAGGGGMGGVRGEGSDRRTPGASVRRGCSLSRWLSHCRTSLSLG